MYANDFKGLELTWKDGVEEIVVDSWQVNVEQHAANFTCDLIAVADACVIKQKKQPNKPFVSSQTFELMEIKKAFAKFARKIDRSLLNATDVEKVLLLQQLEVACKFRHVLHDVIVHALKNDKVQFLEEQANKAQHFFTQKQAAELYAQLKSLDLRTKR